MKKSLIIVESPKKAKTISALLGDNFYVKATLGHLMDLPKKEMGFDPVTFTPTWEVLRGKNKILSEIEKLSKEFSHVYIGTDPDREGEAIAFHIWEKIRKHNRNIFRIRFHEITKESLLQSIEDKTTLDLKLVDAQIARRILDRIAGYGMSPLLWKIKEGISAGRVQSVPLKWIVWREQEINQFIPEEYYRLSGSFQWKDQIWEAEYETPSQEKLQSKEVKEILLQLLGKQAKPSNKTENTEIYSIQGTQVKFVVHSIEEKNTSQKPPPPYITSEFQKDASTKLGISPAKAMLILNQLYEGKNTETGFKGIVTYPRTDSYRISPAAISSGMNFWKKQGETPKAPFYKNKKSTKVQDAHEAIRPTDINLTPEKMQAYLQPMEWKLYDLIWKRFAGCFLDPSKSVETKFILEKDGIRFVGKSKKILSLGYLKVYGAKIEKSPSISFKVGDILHLQELQSEKKYTLPPERYTEASLISKMEKTGIGRPSTYATSLEVLFKREYATLVKKSIYPTELGIRVYMELDSRFSEILEDAYTSQMEDSLDLIESGEMDRVKFLQKFEDHFQSLVKAKPMQKKSSELVKKKCPLCNQGSLVVKNSKKKKPYHICNRFPDCEYMEYLETK